MKPSLRQVLSYIYILHLQKYRRPYKKKMLSGAKPRPQSQIRIKTGSEPNSGLQNGSGT